MKCLVKTYILIHAPRGLAALLRVDTEKINLLEKIGERKCLQWRDITQSFAMLLFVSCKNSYFLETVYKIILHVANLLIVSCRSY